MPITEPSWIDAFITGVQAIHVLDWIIILAYIGLSFGIGIYFMRKASQGLNNYFLAGRVLPWWIIGTSMVATTFAADTPLAITEMVRSNGIWKNWWWWASALTTITSVFVFSRLWRRANVLTDNEMLEIRYAGKKAAVLRMFKAGYFSIVYNMIVMGWVIKGMSTVISVLLGLPELPVTLILVLIALIYATLSGFYGVVFTDLAQFILAMGGAIVLAVLAVQTPEIDGISGLLSAIKDHLGIEQAQQTLAFFPAPPEGVSFFSREFLNSNFFMVIVFLTVLWWSNHSADGGGYLIQRMNSAKSENHAMAGTLWFAIAHYALRVWPWILVALVSIILVPHVDPQFGNKAAYPEVMKQVLPIGLKGLLITTFLAAFMSTIDTHLNWGASYFVNDIYKRFISKQGTEKEYVLVSRITTVGIMILAIIASLVINTIESAWIFVTALGSGIGLVLILRWFWWRINAWSELSALLTSILTVILIKFTPLNLLLRQWIYGDPYNLVNWEGPPGVVRDWVLQLTGAPLPGLAAHWLFLIIVPTSILVWVTVTLVTKPESKETLLRFYKRVHPGGFWKPIEKEVKSSDSGPSLMGWFIFTYWIGAVALIYGLLFGIGHGIFQMWQGFGISLAIAVSGVGCIVFSRWAELRKNATTSA